MLNLTTDLTILENLAQAITEQAAKDYIDAYRYIIRHPEEPTGERNKKEWFNYKKTLAECDAFFKSDMFSAVYKINPKDLIKDLKHVARYGKGH